MIAAIMMKMIGVKITIDDGGDDNDDNNNDGDDEDNDHDDNDDDDDGDDNDFHPAGYFEQCLCDFIKKFFFSSISPILSTVI